MTIFEDNNEVPDQATLPFGKDQELYADNELFPSSKNERITNRYVRDDISVALCEITPISYGKEIFIDFVILNNITGSGMSFTSAHDISTRKKIILNIRFYSNTTFKIHASIAYRTNTPPYLYGIKFDSENYDLSQHLSETQLGFQMTY